MGKRYLSVVVFFATFILAFVCFHQFLIQASYNGLPTVACIDPTQPIKQSFTLWIRMSIYGQAVMLPQNLGHDYANCLREIHVDSVNGPVVVQSNSKKEYHLSDVFTVWHKTFNKQQIFQYPVNDMHQMQVSVNGQLVSDPQNVVLSSGDVINISYE